MEILPDHEYQQTTNKGHRILTGMFTVDIREEANTKPLLLRVQPIYMTKKSSGDWLANWLIMLRFMDLGRARFQRWCSLLTITDGDHGLSNAADCEYFKIRAQINQTSMCKLTVCVCFVCFSVWGVGVGVGGWGVGGGGGGGGLWTFLLQRQAAKKKLSNHCWLYII